MQAMDENKSKNPGCGGLFMIALLFGVPYGFFFHIVLGWSVGTVTSTVVFILFCIYIFSRNED
jgi:hypothetical protein